MNFFRDVIINAGYFILIINTLVFIKSYNNKNKELKYFVMYLLLCFLVQFIAAILSELRNHNLFLSHYFFIGQFIFLSPFYSKLYGFKQFKYLHTFITFAIAFSFGLYLFNFPEAFQKWSVLEITITSIPLLGYSIFYFVKKIEDNRDKKYIYFNSGFFLYTLCSTLIFITGNIRSKELKLYVWLLNSILYLLFQTLIFIEWYKNFRKPLYSTSKNKK